MLDSAARKCTSFFDKFGHHLVVVLQSKYFLGAAFAWFILQAVLIALTIDLFIPPDESGHTVFIKFLAEHGFDPIFVDQSTAFMQGDLERNVSYMYHWIMSPLYALFSAVWDKPLYMLRFINIIFGVGSLIMLKKIGSQLQMPQSVTYFSVFVMGSTLMFVFLSAATNYDNLTIFVSLASFLALIRLLQRFSLWRLLLLATLVAFGSLVKYPFWPLAVFFTVVAVWKMHKERKLLRRHWEEFRSRSRWQTIVVAAALVAMTVLGTERLGGNLLMYGDLRPSCDDVHAVAECRNDPLFKRQQHLQERDINEDRLMNIVEFTPRWVMENVPAVFGIYGHKMLSLPDRLTMPIVALLALALLATIRKIDIRKEPILATLTLAVVGYLAVVMLTNFAISYDRSGVFGHALQGRYTFPVLPLVYLLGFYYIYKLAPRFYMYIFALAVPLLMLAGAPALFALTNSEWYTPLGEKLFYHTDSVRYATDWIAKIIR